MSKSDLRAKKEQKGSPRGTKMLPKTDQKSIPKNDDFFDRFWSAPKAYGTVWPGRNRSKSGGVLPPQKLLAKANSDTIMSLLAN